MQNWEQICCRWSWTKMSTPSPTIPTTFSMWNSRLARTLWPWGISSTCFFFLKGWKCVYMGVFAHEKDFHQTTFKQSPFLVISLLFLLKKFLQYIFFVYSPASHSLLHTPYCKCTIENKGNQLGDYIKKKYKPVSIHKS